MKKLYILISVLLATALLTGCGVKSENTDSTAEMGNTESTERTGNTENTENILTSSSEPATCVSEEPASVKPADLGQITSKGYVNKYVGFGCDLGDGWVVESADQLQEITDDIKDTLAGSALGDTSDGQLQVMDMRAVNPESGGSVNVMYQEVSPSDMALYQEMDDDQIIDSVLKQKDAMIDSYAQAGMTVTEMGKIGTFFLGEDRVALRTVATAGDSELIMVQIFDFHLEGNFTAITTFSAYTPEELASMMLCFYPID